MGSDSAIMAEAPCCFAALNAPSSSCAPPSSITTRSMPSWLEAVRVSPTCKSSAGPVSELNRTTGAYPGSVRTRFSDRKPQSHAYAPLSPVLHYNPGQGDLVGGNFWDMRAPGRRLGNPAAEQAQGPPTNPVEMGLPDIACAVYRASQRPYRPLFESVWGQQAFLIAWPSDVEQVCAQPGPPPPDNPMPVHLGAPDRGLVHATYDQM